MNASSLRLVFERAQAELTAARLEHERLTRDITHGIRTPSMIHALEAAQARLTAAETAFTDAEKKLQEAISGS